MTESQDERRGAMTVGEVIAERERRMREDPAYRAEVEAAEAEREARAAMLREAQVPILQDLARVGVRVESVWKLGKSSWPYPEALPVLMDHLERGGYPDRIMEGAARAFAVKPAVAYWDQLRELYRNAPYDSDLEQGLAVALAEIATKQHLEALIELASDHSRSDNRLLLLRTIKRLGGQRGREVLESLTEDPLLGKEARALLKVRTRQ